MIPRSIHLHNFLSYGDCRVNFTGLHVAVLSGKNGDGKSALLDAMTWALWGEGRGKREDERIRMGADAMLVEFEFESRGDIYRVIRKRTRGRPAGALDFLAVDPSGTVTPLNGSGVRETEREIVSRLRMDYEVFANSAFIAQGRANEFTNRTPAERKEVFRKVLGLEVYETLSKAAKDRSGNARSHAAEAERRIEDDRRAVAELPAIEEALGKCLDQLASTQPRLVAAESEWAELRGAHAEFQRRIEDAARVERELVVVESESGDARARVENLGREHAGTLVLLGRGEEVERDRTRLLDLREEDKVLVQRAREAAELEDLKRTAERSVAEETARLEADAAHSRQEVVRLEQLAAGLPGAVAAVAACEAEEREIAGLEENVEAARLGEAQSRATAAASEATAESCRQQAAELKAKQEQLEGAAECPVCRQPLSPGDLARVQGEYAAQRKALGDQYRAAKDAGGIADEGARRAQELVQHVQAEIRRRRSALDIASREAHAARQAAAQAEEQVIPARERAAALAEMLERGSYAVEARKTAAEAAAALALVGYDASEHDRVRDDIRELAGADEAYTEWKLAAQRAAALEASIVEERARLEALGARAIEARERLQVARDAIAHATDVGPRLQAKETELGALRAEVEALNRAQGRLDAERGRLVALRATIERQLDELKAVREEEDTFGELARGFGKDGVQALLIDQALPRVEIVANQMLDRMTGGRIHVGLATQKAVKAGVTETLDINISDDLGTRDYAMYSGGEAFRVDFALRIALARLLAERSGAELPTLVIDEGFGSQDQEGIDRLVEALNAISDEFRFILVVTHIEELKERFDRRIEVTKDLETGSIARVL